MKKLKLVLLIGLMALCMGLAGCADDGSNGAPGASGSNGASAFEIAVANGFVGTEAEWLASLDPSTPLALAANVEPEQCATCHTGEVIRNGSTHQEFYNELFQPNVVVVSNVNYSNDGTNDIVTFAMTKKDVNGVAQPFDCAQADSLAIVFAEYIPGTDTFELGAPGFNYNVKGTINSVGGTCTSTKAAGAKGDLSLLNGNVIVYGQDEHVDPIKPENVNILEGAHVTLAKFPFAAIQTLGTVTYNSAANVTGCEKCHNVPYFKHGYITGDVSNGGGQDFWTCKACHLDDLNGGHASWQYMADDPQGWANDPNAANLTAAQTARYAYKKNLMNDVHMSHAMEFPYPQSMANCQTCHAGKMAQTTTDANFSPATCKSCHPIDGGTDFADADGKFAVDTRPLALQTILSNAAFNHASIDLDSPTQTCNQCHNDGLDVGEIKLAPSFSEIHPGLNPEIYDVASGVKYADAITVTIDSVTENATNPNLIDIAFSATGSVGSVDSAAIVPDVYVAAYGYDTKDFIFSNHDRDADRNRLGEFTLEAGATSPYFSNPVIGTAGTWSVSFDTSVYDAKGQITNGAIRRLEVAIAPTAKDASGQTVGLNAPSVTYSLTTKAIVADYFKDANALVNVKTGATASKGCNSCHDQLATTFHSGNRGGNITVCRMCHTPMSAGSHLEDQSRSIDSYAHAVHSFQAFDVDRIDFTDPVEVAHYEEHVQFLFPDFLTFNCQACHVNAVSADVAEYNVPDQSMSLPGLLSATDDIPGRPVSASVERVVGPAARSCGGCHRAQKINTGDVGGLASFNQHTKTFGYSVDNDADDVIRDTIISRIMSFFE